MIVALLNQKGGVGKTALALHPAGQSARPETRITLIDGDPQGSVLGWSEQRARRRSDRLFGVIGLARDTLHREAPEFARYSDHIVIDRRPRVAALLRSALLADLALIPAHPSPVDGLESAEMLALIAEVLLRPALRARFVLNRCPARTIIARETAQSLAEHGPLALTARISRRIILRRSSANRSRWQQTPNPSSSGKVAADITPPGSPSRSRRHSADPSKSPPSSAASPSPPCCAICSRANFPKPMEATRESRAKHRARAAP